MKNLFTLVIFLTCIVSVSIAYMLGRGARNVDAASVDAVLEDYPVAQETESPTTYPPSLYELKRISGAVVMYPRVPLMDMNFRPRRYDITPGAYFPGLDGVKLEEAVHIIATTFPMLSVRTVPDGFPINLEVRRDRVTLIIDPATNYVLDARIG